MPNLKDIRRRISTVEKTQQITSAMRMVAAAKLRRAESAIKAARPYAERMRATLAEVAAGGGDVEHPLLVPHETQTTTELVVLTSDRGLAGAFNANAIKHAEAVIRERGEMEGNLVITPIGRKSAEHFKKHYPKQVEQTYEIGAGWIEYPWAAEIAQRLARRYEAGEVDEVVLVYNRFQSVMTQVPVTAPLLPFASPEPEGDAPSGEDEKSPYEFEPSAGALLATLAPRALEVEVYRAALENQAGEHAARMTAMESATRNTEDLIESLTLEYNRARQAAITKELVEIVSGAQALE